MKKNIKSAFVVAAIAVLPIMVAGVRGAINDKEVLLDFIEYCKNCDNLRQVNPAKDYNKASLHELKTVARFYEEQEDFDDCTDYQQQAEIDKIIK